MLAAAVLVLAVAVLVAVATAGGGGGAPVREQVLSVPGTPESDARPVSLDATLYRPAGDAPRPAVLLAHGFGGTKDSVRDQARALAREGYVVLAWSARGFGASGGLIHVDAPAYEVADGSRLLDALAARPEVLTDGAGDPRVAVVGASYGGALALMLAGTDQRVDATVPAITWNDLRQGLAPQQAVTALPAGQADVRPIDTPGVLKKGWAGVFFGSAAAAGGPALLTGSAACGRFAEDVCGAYRASAESGVPTPALLALLAANSPAVVLAQVRAPTLLLQGQTDSLFPLSEADATARALTAAGTPVKQVWFAGGHDGGNQERARLARLTREWLGRYLDRDGSAPDLRFETTAPALSVLQDSQPEAPEARVADGPLTRRSLDLSGALQVALLPPGGTPAALTSLPGVGDVLSTALGTFGARLTDLPGQDAVFDTAPLTERLQVVGSPSVTVRVRSSTGEATLFAKVYDVGVGGEQTLPRQLVAPVHLTGLADTGSDVRIALPAVVLDVPAGHTLRLSLATTDQAFATPTQARVHLVTLAGEQALSVPVLPTRPLAGSANGWIWLVAGLLVALALGAWAVARVRRRRVAAGDPSLAGVPVAFTHLGKAYAGGYRAVSDLSFRVEAGQVLGLLGPNGAGKTTTLRMLMGLILPTEGSITVFGHRVRPGSPVLSRLGSFVEGPGFLPHLSGRDNLELFWRATGRPAADAHLDAALEVAGLGDDVLRKVKTYSQGMRQRLAIAQAMLGLPDLLVLDEPTNGLDPPQIREMRDVLAGYAATGRAVIVSSHLLA
ncbi:MAG: transporter related, partial [Frankiales bacterium]|nr:transporter related [Frankiales bacterium]